MFLALVGAICALALFTQRHDRQLGAYRWSKQTPD
jgi:hypothetical protein